MKKLYQAKNKGENAILIIASSEEGAKEIALKLKFVKNIENLRVVDFSSIYLNADRIRRGLDFNKLENGQFFQQIDGQVSTWSTYMP